MTSFDVIVIGGGVAGGAAATAAAGRGLRVALVERRDRGGPDATAGVVPVRGHGRLAGGGRVAVAGPDGAVIPLAAARVILAPGSRPLTLPGARCDGERILTVDDPPPAGAAAVTIVGAGPAGVELAARLAARGARVTLVEKEGRPLPQAEPDLGAALAAALADAGVALLSGTRCLGAAAAAGAARLDLRDEATRRPVAAAAPCLVLAVGRRPATDDLGLGTIGVDPDRRGRVPVDAWMETSAPGHYAVGDAVASPGLAAVAVREGEIAAEHAAGGRPRSLRLDHVAWTVRGPVEIAWVGLGEAAARARGHRVRVERGGASPWRMTVRDEEDGALLGLHAAGPGAAAAVLAAAAALAGPDDGGADRNRRATRPE